MRKITTVLLLTGISSSLFITGCTSTVSNNQPTSVESKAVQATTSENKEIKENKIETFKFNNKDITLSKIRDEEDSESLHFDFLFENNEEKNYIVSTNIIKINGFTVTDGFYRQLVSKGNAIERMTVNKNDLKYIGNDINTLEIQFDIYDPDSENADVSLDSLKTSFVVGDKAETVVFDNGTLIHEEKNVKVYDLGIAEDEATSSRKIYIKNDSDEDMYVLADGYDDDSDFHITYINLYSFIATKSNAFTLLFGSNENYINMPVDQIDYSKMSIKVFTLEEMQAYYDENYSETYDEESYAAEVPAEDPEYVVSDDKKSVSITLNETDNDPWSADYDNQLVAVWERRVMDTHVFDIEGVAPGTAEITLKCNSGHVHMTLNINEDKTIEVVDMHNHDNSVSD
jgi:hypothetical protein